MNRYAIIKNGVVVNVIEYDTAPNNPPPGFDAGHIAVKNDNCSPGWVYSNGQFTDPNPPRPIKKFSYKEKRAAAYPSIGDQLDALFHAGVFPAEMAAKLQAVKDKYPKT